MHMYTDLAPWFHLLTHPSDYADEAGFVTRVVDEVVGAEARTLLELGSGGGNNASHLKARFECTLTDVSPDMLAASRSLNPECEHIEGDMRTLRLGREFDVVFIHDAVSYLTTEEDLRSALETAAAHVRPGGVVVLNPDATTETFRPGTDHGGHDGDDGRRLRYLEWTHDREPPGGTTYTVDFVIAVQARGEELRIVHDRHVLGVFPQATWERMLTDSGLELVEPNAEDPYAGEHAVFVARRPT
jgi:SAM-dependent methyltransferase